MLVDAGRAEDVILVAPHGIAAHHEADVAAQVVVDLRARLEAVIVPTDHGVVREMVRGLT